MLGDAAYHYSPPGRTRLVGLEVSATHIVATLEDGREIRVPLGWFPILRDAAPEERQVIEFDVRMTWAFFPRLNTEVSVDQILAYRDGADEDAFIAASASEDEDRLLADIEALVRKAVRVTGRAEGEILAAVTGTR